jgi:hypothetical protein
MFLRNCTVILFSFSCAAGWGSEPLETIRQQFEIYTRHSGELEILQSGDTKQIDGVLKRTEAKRFTAQKELDKESQKIELPHTLFAADYAAPFLHYSAVELAAAKRSLQLGKPDEAVKSIQYIYRLADKLSLSGLFDLRLAAAKIRLQTLELIQTFLLSPICRSEDHQTLYGLFERQINHTPADKVTWTQYQTEGKKFYEKIIQEGFEKTIPQSMLKELLDRNAFDAYQQGTAEQFLRDQTIFLRVMGTVIESCELPFYQRQPVLSQLKLEIQERQGTSAEPVIAGILLQNIAEDMRFLAQERTSREMIYLGLSVSRNGRQRQATRNFLTGKEYELKLIPDGVMCTYEGNIKPFYVPYR